jgi:hypothetical protein
VSQRALAQLFHQRFVSAAMVDQVGDRADLQAVLRSEKHEDRAGGPWCRRPS